MHPEHRSELSAMLPGELPYPYFPAREAPWLVLHRLSGPRKIGDLRRGPLAGMLERTGARDVIAACGDGRVRPHQLLPLADPLEAFGRERELMTDRAAEAAFDLAASEEWRQFTVSFTTWGSMLTARDWRWAQISRKGENLVLQLNFPREVSAKLRYLMGNAVRQRFEPSLHPVRKDAEMTLAWVRLDFDPWGEDVLIEEIQSDWIRVLRLMLKRGLRGAVDGLPVYIEQVLAVYGSIWSRAAMLAALAFSVRELGMRRIWMHQPECGAKLKAISDQLPPRSIYTDLPRKFGFQPTERAPEFLYPSRSKVLSRLRKSGQPLFWLLDLHGGMTVQEVVQSRSL